MDVTFTDVDKEDFTKAIEDLECLLKLFDMRRGILAALVIGEFCPDHMHVEDIGVVVRKIGHGDFWKDITEETEFEISR